MNLQFTGMPARSWQGGIARLQALLLAGCLASAALAPVFTDAPAGLTEIIILHDNDIHFDFNHPEAFKQVVEGFRGAHPDVFLLSAGDIFTRREEHWPENTREWYGQRCWFMVETMNAIGYDAMTLGNNEVDYKDSITRDSLRLAQFPILGANVTVSDPAVFDQPEPYAILTTGGGLTLAVLGLSVGTTPGGVQVGSPLQAAEKYRHLREHNVWLMLTHLRTRSDLALLEKFPEVDAIIGGHSAGSVTPAETINGVLYTRLAGQSPKVNTNSLMRLGVLRLYLKDGKVCGKAGDMITIQPDGTYMRDLTVPVVAGLEFPQAGTVAVSVRNPLALNTLSVTVALELDGAAGDANVRELLLRPGESRVIEFSLPAGLAAGVPISARITVQRPTTLPRWEQELDFSPIVLLHMNLTAAQGER